ncbi:MAG TPA: hypothetical protein VIL20_20235, partial [Sandaracinaceae bacterium]
VRMAMDRIRRDVARAGYLSVSDTRSPFVRMCPTPAPPRQVQAVWFQNDDPQGLAALNPLNRQANGVSADRLRLVGNFATSDSYLVRSMDSTGGQIFLQTDWLGFRRSFVVGQGGGATLDVQRFNQVFAPGRMLHIETPNGFHFLVNITGTIVNAAGNVAAVTISPPLGADNPCLRGLGRGSIVAPVSEVEYFVGPARGVLAPADAAVTGANTVLYRQELDMAAANGQPIPGTTRPVLEWAVDFNLDFVVDLATPGNPPDLVRQNGANAAGAVQGSGWRVRSVIVSLAARTPEQDPRFPWPSGWGAARPNDAPLNRFRVFSDRPGAARVRQLTTEIVVPNLVP